MDNKNTALIIQYLQNQLTERLEKLWKLFSWSSSILISITAGMIGLKQYQNITFGYIELLIISFIICLMCLYSYLWLHENLLIEVAIRDRIDDLFKYDISYTLSKELRADKSRFGYKTVILLLGSMALLATWLSKISAGG